MFNRAPNPKNLIILVLYYFRRYMENANAIGIAEGYTARQIKLAVIGINLGWIFAFYDLLLASFTLTFWEASFGVGLATVSLALTANLIGTAIGGIIFGWLGDILGRKKTLYITILIYAIFTGLVAFSNNISEVISFRFIGGLGMGGEWGIGFSLLSEIWPHESRGGQGGFLEGAASFGVVGAAALGYFAMPVVGWRLIYLLSSLLAFFIIFVRIGMPESKKWLTYKDLKAKGELPEHLKKESQRTPIFQIFSKDLIGTTLKFLLMSFAALFTYYSITSFLPVVTEQLHLSAIIGFAVLAGFGGIEAW